MKKRTRILALLLALLALSLTIVSCKNNNASQTESQTPSTDASTDVGEQLDLPEMNFNGTVINFASIGQEGTFKYCEFATEEYTDEPVNDAVYDRNALIESKYGIKITVTNHKDYNALVDGVTSNINTGSNYFQAVAIPIMYTAVKLGTAGFLYDLNAVNEDAGVDYLHLTKEWWDQSAVRDLSISNVLYYATGDICVSDNGATWAVFFNKDIVQDNGIEDLYSVVKVNNWTIDYMHTCIKQATKLVGDTMDYTEDTDDTWGMVSQTYDGVAFMWGCAQSMVQKDDNDIPSIRLLADRNVEVFGNVLDMLIDLTNVGVADHYGRWDSGIYGVKTKIFTNGHALFLPGSINTVDSEEMRNASIHYGILPMPLADENQEEYSSHGNVYDATVVSIPISVKESELAPILYAFETMAYYGKQMVTDEYYEVTLKNKRFTDDDSPEMLDIISRNRTWDLAAIYDWGSALYIYTDQIGAKTNTLVSKVQEKNSTIESAMQKTIEAIESNK
ncbi:MAG TPA: hypothetical protein PLT66_07555 [Bacillota bacterium]|nr:hypothetical protein [Bacillota bacterium]